MQGKLCPNICHGNLLWVLVKASKNAKERRREPGGIQIQREAYIQTSWVMRIYAMDCVSAELSHWTSSNTSNHVLIKNTSCVSKGSGPC